MIVKLLTEHHLEFLSLKGGCRGSSDSTLVKMSNCWKSRAAAQMPLIMTSDFILTQLKVPCTYTMCEINYVGPLSPQLSLFFVSFCLNAIH